MSTKPQMWGRVCAPTGPILRSVEKIPNGRVVKI